jgi:hypothetical protein
VLSDRDVEVMLELRDEGLSYRRLATIMEISLAQVGRICIGLQRAQVPVKFKRI